MLTKTYRFKALLRCRFPESTSKMRLVSSRVSGSKLIYILVHVTNLKPMLSGQSIAISIGPPINDEFGLND